MMHSTDDRAAPRPGRGAANARVDAGDAALLAALKSLTLDQLGDLLGSLFERADARLLDQAERAASHVQRRIVFETMRVLRDHRHAITSTFTEQLVAGFSPRVVRIAGELEISIDDLALREARLVEESIALGNLESKAAQNYRAQLWDIDRRIDWLIGTRRTPIARDAMAPVALARAFRMAIEPLHLDLESVLQIYRLFESEVMQSLAGYYESVLRLMRERGVQAAPAPAPKSREDAGRSAPRAGTAGGRGGGHGYGMAGGQPGAGGGGAGGGAAGGPPLDPQTLALLGRVAQAAASVAPAYYGDAHLAQDLSCLMSGEPVPGWSERQQRAYSQRVSLVGRMFNELIDDIALAEDEVRSFDLLRFAVIKRALGDIRFFDDVVHPVRRLVNELVTMIAVSHATGGDMGERMERLIAEVRAQFDDAAAGLRSPEPPPEPIDEDLIERFVAEQAENRGGRRRAVVSRVREIVSAELRLRTAEAEIPESVRPLLYGGWSVLMAYRLTHHGLASPEWKDGVDLLYRIQRALLPPDGQAPGPRELSALAEELHEQLIRVGLSKQKVDAMIVGLWQAMESRGHRRLSVVASNAGSGAALAARETLVLDLLLVPDRWFHLHDEARKARRWLRYLGPVDGAPELLEFGEFDGGNPLRIGREALLEDLAAQRSEPIDLPPNCRKAFDAMVARRARMRAA